MCYLSRATKHIGHTGPIRPVDYGCAVTIIFFQSVDKICVAPIDIGHQRLYSVRPMNSPAHQSTACPARLPENGYAAIEMFLAAFLFATMSCIAHGYSGRAAWPLIAFARIFVTLVFTLGMMWWFGAPLLFRGTMELWMRSLFGTTGLLCTFYAVTHLPLTDMVTIFATGPIWIALILLIVMKQRMPRTVWLHAGWALLGVYVMYRPRFDAGAFPVTVALLGAVAAAAAMVSLSMCHRLHRLSVVAHFSICSTAASLFMCLISPGRILEGMTLPMWFWLLPMGLAGAFAQILMTSAYARGSTTLVALVGISQIGFAAMYDFFIWGYPFDWWKVAGVTMIAVAIVMSVLTRPAAATLPVNGDHSST